MAARRGDDETPETAETPSPAAGLRFLVTRATGVSVTEDDSNEPRIFQQGEYLSDGAAERHADLLTLAGFVTAVPVAT